MVIICSDTYNGVYCKLSLPFAIFFFNTAKYSILSYSTRTNLSKPYPTDIKPQVILSLDLYDKDFVKLHEGLLRGKGGIYSLINTVSGKQYIGSVKDFFIYKLDLI